MILFRTTAGNLADCMHMHAGYLSRAHRLLIQGTEVTTLEAEKATPLDRMHLTQLYYASYPLIILSVVSS